MSQSSPSPPSRKSDPPPPPLSVSSPPCPYSTSSPALPLIVSLCSVPRSVSLPLVPLITAIGPILEKPIHVSLLSAVGKAGLLIDITIVLPPSFQAYRKIGHVKWLTLLHQCNFIHGNV
ncbi:hypothetical protein CU102_15110 [Phyllobacterium brassicacearum]|uniref:Uncharacterized protein n=1 Tax=Phyllobacterium brassicacearum TaxID=314235 RepID=A0A2P7BP53_9HYPH|nr:hypothetical protein CU102_15110 [Phyllobacterium brassicacearum]